MRIIDRTAGPSSVVHGPGAGLASQLLRPALLCAAAASLAACAQSSAVRQARWAAPTKQAAAEFRPQVQRAETAPESVVRVRQAELSPPPAHATSSGLASYYSEGRKTASGERFDPSELTAAHRSLPFGTRLQVTNVKTGRSVVVRVNDRGPFVQGRVVDVSYSAAQALGMIHTGVAPVKVSVVR
ncbi:septal ring lytic transglycosylase RlpA family protein [Bradyrhizobium oligotrophicum]|uniref:septal ring lytic transglycosylase RlpA family protein n=1 Tax=Bradyrhizobium oligotrophicum TaxID=44255 RepID=UPI003EB8E332